MKERIEVLLTMWVDKVSERDIRLETQLSQALRVEVAADGFTEVIFEFAAHSTIWKDLLVSFVSDTEDSAHAERVEFFDRVGRTVHPTWS